MPSEQYFGPEVVDRDVGGEFVRELKAATAFIIGTAPIHEAHEDTAAWTPYINKKILVRRRSDIAKYFGPVRDGYTLPQYLDAQFDQAGTKGIGTLTVVNVFDPDVHKTGEDPDPSLVTNLDIIGEFDAAGTPSGLQLAYGNFQSFGWFCKNIAAPGFDGLTGVLSEMIVIANRTRARIWTDAPLGVTVQQVIEARGSGGLFNWQLDSTRLNLCWPHMKVVNLDDTSPTAGQEIDQPLSPRALGRMLATVVEFGYHHSPSNRPIEGTEGPSQETLYIPGDYTSDVQLLRGAGIVSVEQRWGKGPHLSGNRSSAYPTNTDMRNFIHVQYIEDVLDEAILFFLDEWKDRNASPASLDFIEDRINAYLGTKMTGSDPVLYGGRFSFDRKKTTPETVADGWFFWKLEYMPVSVMERLTVERWINIKLSRDPLGLSTAVEPLPLAA